MRSVSVVMPVRHEAATIEKALRSIIEQDHPGIVEIIVADAMSTDGTREVVARLAAADARIRVVDNLARTTPAGLNAAIRASTGDVVVRCDAHAVLPPGYISRAVELLAETGADNVGGMQVAHGTTLRQRAIARAMHTPMGVGDARFHLGGPPGPVDTVYLGVFRRAALDRVGLFDEALARNQDSELNYRLTSTGGIVYFHPDLKVVYRPRSSLRSLARQYFTSGAWKRQTFRRHVRAIRWRQMAPPALVLALVGSAVLAFTPARRFAVIVPALYGVAILGASLWNLIRRADPAALLLPVVLPTMHIAWGLGLLFGRSSVDHLPIQTYSQSRSDGTRRLITRRLGEIWSRRLVLKRLTSEDLKVKYEGAALGYVWSVLEPLLLTGVYWLVFEKIFHAGARGIRAGTQPYALFLIVGLLPWTLFNTVVTQSTKALTSNARLITKVHMPRELFPLALVSSKTAEFGLSLGVLVIFAVLNRTAPSMYILAFPLAVLIEMTMLVGLALFLSALNTLLRDVERLVGPALRVLFYMSVVLFPLANVPDNRFGAIVRFNPLVGVFELFHAGWYPQLFPGWGLVAYSGGTAVLILIAGWALFLKAEPHVLKEL